MISTSPERVGERSSVAARVEAEAKIAGGAGGYGDGREKKIVGGSKMVGGRWRWMKREMGEGQSLSPRCIRFESARTCWPSALPSPPKNLKGSYQVQPLS